MRGLDRIAAVRRRGLRPIDVVIEPLYPCDIELSDWIQYEPSDIPELTDLRPLVGLWVSVMGDGEMAERWARAACKAGASDVVTVGRSSGIEMRRNGVDVNRIYEFEEFRP
jgi:hypothetical protein